MVGVVWSMRRASSSTGVSRELLQPRHSPACISLPFCRDQDKFMGTCLPAFFSLSPSDLLGFTSFEHPGMKAGQRVARVQVPHGEENASEKGMPLQGRKLTYVLGIPHS